MEREGILRKEVNRKKRRFVNVINRERRGNKITKQIKNKNERKIIKFYAMYGRGNKRKSRENENIYKPQ